jgi:hypothetical protein
MKKMLFLGAFCAFSHSPTLLSAQTTAPHGLRTQGNMLDLPNLVAYYEYDGEIKNLASPADPPLKAISTLSFRDGHLYSNGSYQNYYDQRPPSYYHDIGSADGFTISATIKAENFGDNTFSTLLKIEGEQRYFYLNRHKDNFFMFEFEDIKNKQPEIKHNYTNTNFPTNTWCNITIIYSKKNNSLQTYINSEALPAVPLKNANFDVKNINFDFTNARRGGVFHGHIDKLTFFNAPLQGSELQTLLKLMSKDVSAIKSLVDKNKIINNGTDNPEQLLGISNLTSYYVFNKNVDNLVKPDQTPFAVRPPFSYQNGGLYCNGSYKDYDDYSGDEYISVPTANNKGNFSVALSLKFDKETEAYIWGRHAVKIDAGEGKVILISRQKDGILTLDFDNFVGQYVEGRTYKFENTQIPSGQWAHIVLSFDQQARTAQIYLNGKAQRKASLNSYDITKARAASIYFANRSNGNVFLGTVANLAIFDKAISAAEASTAFKKMTATLGNISNMQLGAPEIRNSMTHKVDENWTYLPSCVRGVKAKYVKIQCQDGADLRFMISANEEETDFFILENGFSPPLEDSETHDFKTCLQHLLTIARQRCQ